MALRTILWPSLAELLLLAVLTGCSSRTDSGPTPVASGSPEAAPAAAPTESTPGPRAPETLPDQTPSASQPRLANQPHLTSEPRVLTAQPVPNPAMTAKDPTRTESSPAQPDTAEPSVIADQTTTAVRRAVDLSGEEPQIAQQAPKVLQASPDALPAPAGPLTEVPHDAEPPALANPGDAKALAGAPEATPTAPVASATPENPSEQPQTPETVRPEPAPAARTASPLSAIPPAGLAPLREPPTATEMGPSTFAQTPTTEPTLAGRPAAPGTLPAPTETAPSSPAPESYRPRPEETVAAESSSGAPMGHPLRGGMTSGLATEGQLAAEPAVGHNPLRSGDEVPGLLPQLDRPARPAAATPQPIAQPQPLPMTDQPVRPVPPPTETAGPARGGTTAPVVTEAPGRADAHDARPAEPEKEKYDPIKENGRIFVGWPQEPPKLAFLISGRQEGYLEPCGCAGLDRMKGGVSRRHMLIRMLREQEHWPLVCLDVGALSKGFGKQAELKFQTTVEAYRRMGYSAIGLGLSDLRLSAGDLLSYTTGTPDQASPFVSANVGLIAFDPSLVAPYRVFEAGGRRIGVTAVLGQEYQKEVRNSEVVLAPPEEKLAPVVEELKKKADYRVLLAFATLDESRALSRRFPEFQMVVTAGGAPEPPARVEVIEPTKALMVEVGEKTMNVEIVAYYDDAQTPVRYQRVPLDSRFHNSSDMRALMASYQDRLKDMGFEGLGLRPVPHPQREPNGRFVGSHKCEACHESSYKIWKKSGHAKAYQTLVDAKPPRQNDPECISCHVVGWNAQKYFPYESGFWSLKTTPKLIDVGCESCHGPGEAHVAAEMGSNTDLQAKMQKAMVVTKEEAQKHFCATCHDLDNSPDFKFETYWPKIEHYEKE